VESLLDYVESYPTFGISSVPPPPPALDESIGDVVELDINGNMNAHPQFLEPAADLVWHSDIGVSAVTCYGIRGRNPD